MTSVLARIGQFDTRRAVTTLWSSGKRKKGDWVCAECRARRPVKVLGRGYSDDALRLNGEGAMLGENEGSEETAEPRRRRGERGLGARARRDDAGDEVPEGNRSRRNVETSFLDQQQPDLARAVGSPVGTTEEQIEELWEHFEVAEDFEDTSVLAGTGAEIVEDEIQSIQESTMLDIDYKGELSNALLASEPDMVFRCLFAASQANDLEWIRSIPTTTFSEIIQVLEPSNFVAKLGSAHVEISNAMTRMLAIAPMRQVAYEYMTVLRQAVVIRRSAGIKMTLQDYIILLRSARDLGSQKMGSVMWNALLDDGHTPNTQCYNYYMATVVWNGVHSAGPRQRVRVIPFHILARKKPQITSRYRNYRVGAGGMRETAMRIFNEMLAHGAIADEQSFRILITAAAREGDINTVKAVLKKVWEIDIDGILAGKDEETITPRQLPEHSPLMPTTSLLWTIAHAFGINNDIPTALRAVDFVARNYNLQIGIDVWEQLFEWTFVLAMPRYGTAKRNSSNVGQLPPKSVMSLWQTMTGDPYRIEPTIGMYNHLIKNLFARQNTPQLMDNMRHGHKLFVQHKNEAHQLRRRLKAQLHNRANGFPHDSIEILRGEWEHADLIRHRDLLWLKRWLRLLLASVGSWARFKDPGGDLFSRRLPSLLWDWREFAPRFVRYKTPTGHVEIVFHTQEEMLAAGLHTQRRRERTNALMKDATRYVGHTWVRGGKAKPTHRVEKHLSMRAEDERTKEP